METSLACVEGAKVLMYFLKFRIYFIVIYRWEEYVKIQA